MAPTEKKIVVVGDSACGKTCLLVGFAQDEFPRDYVHTTFNTYSKQLTVNKRSIKLSLWDTAGQIEYDRIRPLAYPDTDVFLLCFALDCPDSFVNIQEKWFPEVKHFCPRTPVLLVGTKKDMRCNFTAKHEHISTEEGKHLAKKHDMFDYVECSASTSAGVREVFETAVRALQNSAKKSSRRQRRLRCTIL